MGDVEYECPLCDHVYQQEEVDEDDLTCEYCGEELELL